MEAIQARLIEAAIGVAVALLLRRYVCMFALVKGKSMLDTLENHDVLFALRRPICRRIRRFDIVLCRYPRRKGLFVKRVIALPGETISVENGVLMIDGDVRKEPFALRKSPRSVSERSIGADEYFLMGDNRLSSHDSRSASVGPIAQTQIVAVAKCILFPPRRLGRIK